MKILAVRLDAPVHFTAYVLNGDEEQPERTWVCVRAADSAPAVSWLGCWSRDSGAGSEGVKQFLELLSDSVSSGGTTGPYGPTLGRVKPFQGWDSWGPGIPRPILGIRPWETKIGDLGEISIGDLNLS